MKAIKGLSKIVIFSALAAFLAASSMLYSMASGGTPGFPHNFYGTLTINGNPAPMGTGIRGMIEGADRTFNGPYETNAVGQYGSTEEGKFGVDCSYGESIVFSVETSPGQFRNATQTASCDPGADTNLNIIVTFDETCTNGQTRQCGQTDVGECQYGTETCSDGQWGACMGAVNPTGETCDNKDNDCDGSSDESLSQSCGSGQCTGTQTCSAGQWSGCSTSGMDCGVCSSCSPGGICSYDSSQDNDCDGNDIPGIATCTNTPDGNPFTWDFRTAFDSQCTGMDSCSQGSGTVTSSCSKTQCDAQCEINADCAATDCDNLDGCYGGTFRDYSDVPNTCQSCQCTSGQCGSYITIVTDNDQDGYDTQCEQDCNDMDTSVYPGAPELCDGKDNDCDGANDEGCQCMDGQTMNCGSTNAGECEYGTQTCSGGQWGQCIGYVGPVPEACSDGLDNDCDGFADCTDSDCSQAENCQQQGYCLQITGMRVLNSMQVEDYTIPAGTMYYIEMSTYNGCDQDVNSMQIAQVLKGLMPVNLGSVESNIHATETSVVTAGFIMPNGTPQGTQFTAKGYNWNHWIDQNPETFEILSEPGQVAFTSE